MNDNVMIARWLGAEQIDHGREYEDDDLVLDGDYVLMSVDLCRTAKTKGWKNWPPSTDITLWHDGLLQKIEEQDDSFVKSFIDGVIDGLSAAKDFDAEEHVMYYDGVNWPTYRALLVLMKATPAQLTAALVAVIKEE